mmetsp:Transcript_14419/g.22751  ORF Transcript_14419/g.22751 Transcript_14419/m.22751 type:complete len:226 (+) Transcript_14419:54-731(+)
MIFQRCQGFIQWLVVFCYLRWPSSDALLHSSMIQFQMPTNQLFRQLVKINKRGSKVMFSTSQMSQNGGYQPGLPDLAENQQTLQPLQNRKSDFFIPLDRLEITFTRSSGAGGQNVNKVSTRVEIRFNVEEADWIPYRVRQRLKVQQKQRISKEGQFFIACDSFRTQLQNKQECIKRLRSVIDQAFLEPKKRETAWKPSRNQKEKKMKLKSQRSAVKSQRKNVKDW